MPRAQNAGGSVQVPAYDRRERVCARLLARVIARTSAHLALS